MTPSPGKSISIYGLGALRCHVLLSGSGGNFLLPDYPGLIFKENYWRWPERDLAGNTIDFHIEVLGLSFHQAMLEITTD